MQAQHSSNSGRNLPAASRVADYQHRPGAKYAVYWLRVCPKVLQHSRNFGGCEKCVQTILSLRALGMGLPACFKQDISDRQIVNLKIGNKDLLPEFERIVEAAKAADISDSWVKALETCVKLNRLYLYLDKFQSFQRFRLMVQGLQPLLRRKYANS